MKTYLITGGAGFIGSNFIRYLFKSKNNIRIINFDKLTYCGISNKFESLMETNGIEYTFVQGDICNKNELMNIFASFHPEYIINFAAETHVDRSIKYPDIFVKTNILGTQTLLDLALQFDIQKYVQISTDEVYGSLDKEGYFTESTPLTPRNPYSSSKAGADLLVKAYSSTYKLPVNITRCSNNYGPFQYPEKLIPLVINNCLNNMKIPIYGDGKNIRDWLYVEDHCEAIDFVINEGEPGEIYNIGGNNEKENIQIVKMIIDSFNMYIDSMDDGKKHINYDLITYVEDRKGHDRRYAIDATKIRNNIGWKPKVNLEEGIKRTVSWYLKNSRWLSDISQGQYQNYYSEMYK